MMNSFYEGGTCQGCGGPKPAPEVAGEFAQESTEFSPELGLEFQTLGEEEGEFPMTSFEFPMTAEQDLEIIGGVDSRRRVSNTLSTPFKHICKLEMVFVDPRTGARSAGGCSGALVAPNKVLTAAHCVFGAAKGLARQVRVIPAKNGPGRSQREEPFGFAFSTRLDVPNQWRTAPTAFSPYDYSVITLDRPIGQRIGGPWFRLTEQSDRLLLNNRVNTAGYPGDKGGNEQYFAYDRIVRAYPQRIEFLHDAWWGQSGSPIWVRWRTVRWIVGILTTVDDPNTPVRANTGVRIAAGELASIRRWIST